jgi:hypothetical protein
MGSNRDHHGVGGGDPLDKAERDLMGVFGLARRFQRAWNELMSPEQEPAQPRARQAPRPRSQRTAVDATIVEDSPTGVKIVVRQSDKPIKSDGR